MEDLVISGEYRQRQHKLIVVGPRDKVPSDYVVVNTTSRSSDFGKAFSPFMQGDIELYGLRARNVENFWQYTKVFQEHVDDNEAWEEWRDRGLAQTKAVRYPMGKGRKALCARINGKDLDYIEARKQIYVPIYRQKLRKYCMGQLNSLVDLLTVSRVALWDFDGYLTDDKWSTILNNPEKKMGHAFVIWRELTCLGFGVEHE